jgi:hypothetical protein
MARVHDPVQALRMIARLPTPTPSSMGYFYSGELAAKVRQLVATERFDLIFVHCSSVAQYVSAVRGIPKVLDFGDMDSQKWLEYVRFKPLPLKAGYWAEGRKLERTERRLAGEFDLCTATTRAEWETLDSFGTATDSDWFPNGVDPDYFAPDGTHYETDRICFVGRMDYYPNQECMFDFCTRVWPLIRARRPAMHLDIVGADPSAAVRRLAEVPGVHVTGSVPDVRPFVRRSTLMVAPLNIARGTQNKILESMAMGVPVVSSSIAAGGVDADAGSHLLVADAPREIAEIVVRLSTDPAERARLSAASRERMLTHHAWPRSMERLDGIVARCIDRFQERKVSASEN